CPASRIDDGYLDVTVVGPISKATLVRLFPRVYSGRHVEHPAVTTYRARRVSLAAPGVTAYADGERIAPLPLTVTVVPGALRVLAPPPAG
ncbi:MAG TPA: sphingosine kinase, partial [Actinomycetes bacterium]|nr:sphingosine kinase [Actinomycetes bacterium]